MKIGRHDTEKKVLVIAEVGNNHEGDYSRAEAMVRAAARCGVDVVKFQTFKAELFVNKNEVERFQRYKRFELTFKQFEALSRLAANEGLVFMSTPLDLESAVFLNDIVPAFKIASGDNNFFPLLKRVAETGKNILLSTGASDLRHVRLAKNEIEKVWRRKKLSAELALLHCVSSYPVPSEEANLAAISTLQKKIGGTVGYSDHTLDIEASVMAVALGARIIEKHFTLDKHQSDFRDHQLSADPAEMSALVRRVAAVELMLGSGEKTIQPCEKNMVQPIRRSAVAKQAMAAGHKITRDDIVWLRPAVGISPEKETTVVGRVLRHPVNEADVISPRHLRRG